jgi:transketolase
MNYENLLLQLVNEDERFIVMTAENRAAIRNIPKHLSVKFIDTGITEQTLIGMAAGLALRGRIPIVHALASFLTLRAYEFIRTDIGIANLPVKLIGGVPGILSEANGPTHQAIEDISVIRSIPNVNIFAPADENDLLIGLKDILYSSEPFYIRFNNLKTDFQHSKNFEIGKAELIEFGSHLTILTYGTLFKNVCEAAELLKSNGIFPRIYNMRSLKPIDEQIIINSAIETAMIVTVEDHFLTGGLFSIVCEILVKNNLSVPVLPIAFNNWFKPALLNDIIDYEKLNAASIANKIISYYEDVSDIIKVKSLI